MGIFSFVSQAPGRAGKGLFRKGCCALVAGIALSAMSAAPGICDVRPKITEIVPPKTILFVGNSFTYYNNSLHNHVGKLVREASNEKYFLRGMTISGGYLSDHQYGFEGTAKSRAWDIIVIQGNSNEPVEEKKRGAFVKYARMFANIAREAKAEPVFFMTWAYPDKPEMTGQLRDAYTAIANETDALVVPVGLAFARSLAENPDIALIREDKRHPTVPGTYLIACTMYAALMKKSPEGLRYDMDLGAETASALQKTAWNTTREFYGWQ